MADLLESLNESQRSAVLYCDGPSLVIAGAGSGKTRVLTYKIAYLLQQGYDPWSILALTFTNKAAREMKERLGGLIGDKKAHYLYMGTFHSIFARILRNEVEVVGYRPNFTIYDEKDSQNVIKQIIKELQLDDKKYKPSAVHSRISKAKNQLVFPHQYAQNDDLRRRDAHADQAEVSRIYALYQEKLLRNNAMDFDDLLVVTYQLFNTHTDICRKYADRFRYILVDEYQDTNYVQQQIVLQLTRWNQYICAVGDDYQSIYAFRGAKIDNILNFQKIYDDVRVFKLERNYRSTPEIVNAANSLMKHNQYQIDKNVYSENEAGDKVLYHQLYSDREEAAVVGRMIRKLKKTEGCKYSDFAILYRTNAQSRTFEDEFRTHTIPYRIVGGTGFYQRKEIKDVIAYFRLVVNPDDEQALRRIINYPARGIGATTLDKIGQCANDNHVSLWTVISDPDHYGLSVNRGVRGKLQMFVQLIEGFRNDEDECDASRLGDTVIRQSGIYDELCRDTDVEAVSRQENINELRNSLAEFVENRREEGRGNSVGLDEFLQEVSLLSDADSDEEGDDKIYLMTMHAAKGLEFATVFIVGLEEKIFPSILSSNSLRELEEERRLLYVAITRARKHCILTSTKNRWQYGKLEFASPSRFIRDISPQYLDVVGDGGYDDSASLFSCGQDTDGDGCRFRSFRNPRNSVANSQHHEWQNSRPVADRFVADRKAKITSPRQPETCIDPFSDRFKNRFVADRGNLRKFEATMTTGGRTMTDSAQSANADTRLAVGTVIEHQRFGIGVVRKIEGTGENTKATVEFKNTGTKQLLLKFARYTVKASADGR